jgi:hypothetical protein
MKNDLKHHTCCGQRKQYPMTVTILRSNNMPKYFGSIQLVIEAPNEEVAEAVQKRAAEFCVDIDEGGAGLGIVVEGRADEPVEEDEFGHAG